MKINSIKLILALSLQLPFLWTFSQNPDTIYFNDRWEICDRSFAKFYRIGTISLQDSFVFYAGPIHDYYLNGTLEMEGAYSVSGSKDGSFSFYFPDGKLQAHGNFTKNKIYGSWDYYYTNGIKKAKVYYAGDESSFIVLDYFDSTGNQLAKDGTGKFEMYVKDNDGIGSNSYILDGEFLNGDRDGTWNYFAIDFQNHAEHLMQKEVYKNGKLKVGEHYGSSIAIYKNGQVNANNGANSYYTPMQLANYLYYDKFFATERFFKDKFSFAKNEKDSSDKNLFRVEISHENSRDTIGAFRDVEIKASFIGGEITWQKFLDLNIHPENIFRKLPRDMDHISGTVIVQFVVCVDGTVCEIKILNDVSPALADEAERIVKLSSRKWVPAIQKGKQVKAFRVVPITFHF